MSNHNLSKERIFIENVIRRLKVFRILIESLNKSGHKLISAYALDKPYGMKNHSFGGNSEIFFSVRLSFSLKNKHRKIQPNSIRKAV
jgi:hypothetical protein